jgi:hypothetical protein
MIVFRLNCTHGHGFEGWFASAEDFDRQSGAGQVACPLCDNREVMRLPSAPYVNTGARSDEAPVPKAPAGLPVERLRELKAFLIGNTEDVGRRFPEVARRIHYGEEKHRGIRGEVSPAEAEELHDEGIPVVPLPPGLILSDKAH